MYFLLILFAVAVFFLIVKSIIEWNNLNLLKKANDERLISMLKKERKT